MTLTGYSVTIGLNTPLGYPRTHARAIQIADEYALYYPAGSRIYVWRLYDDGSERGRKVQVDHRETLK